MNGFAVAAAILRGAPVTRDYRAVQPLRGYRPTFDPDRPTSCPGCGRSAWEVGRSSAECAGCGTALPLAPANHAPTHHGDAR